MRPTTSTSTTARQILRRARRQLGLTQAELAERAGVSRTVVARYEAGKQQPSIAAVERLLGACGYELEWTVRHVRPPESSVAKDDAAFTVNAADRTTAARFPGPIGRRLTERLDEVLTLLASAGATDPRIHGGVADGTEPVDCPVLIGVTLPPGAGRLPLISAAGHIALLLGASVHVLPHADIPAYGYEDEGVPLCASDTARAMGTPAR